MKRTPIKPRSRKGAKTEAVRAKLRKALIAERGEVCQGCGYAGPVDMHERLPRGRGGDPTDPANILLLCRLCHSLCHQFPAEAERRGLIVRRWPRA